MSSSSLKPSIMLSLADATLRKIRGSASSDRQLRRLVANEIDENQVVKHIEAFVDLEGLGENELLALVGPPVIQPRYAGERRKLLAYAVTHEVALLAYDLEVMRMNEWGDFETDVAYGDPEEVSPVEATGPDKRKSLEGHTIFLRFKQDAELVLSDWDDANDSEVVSDRLFETGEEVEVDVLADHGDSLDLQLASGSIAYRVPTSIFRVV